MALRRLVVGPLLLALPFLGLPIDASQDLPDLVVVEVTLDSEHPETGDEVPLRAVIRNDGPGVAQPSHVRFHIRDYQPGFKDLGLFLVPAIPPGHSVVAYSDPWLLPKHDYYLAQVDADALDEVLEVQEAHHANTLWDYVAVGPPELSVYLSGGNVPANGFRSFPIMVINSGTRSPATILRVWMDGAFVADIDVPALGDVDWVHVETPALFVAPGGHTLRAHVDPEGIAPDGGRFSNEAQTTVFGVVRGVDLSPDQQVVQVAPLFAYSVPVTLTNTGNIHEFGYTLTASCPDQPQGCRPNAANPLKIGGVNPGQRITIQVHGNAPPPPYLESKVTVFVSRDGNPGLNDQAEIILRPAVVPEP